jgi:cold shock CspA family protein
MSSSETNMQSIRDNELLEEMVDTIEHGDIIGNCKWFNKKLGYGFITVYDGPKKGCNIFVHHSGIRPLNSNFKTLRKGEYVHFSIVDGQNGPQATHVTGVCGGPLMCDNIEMRHPSSRIVE